MGKIFITGATGQLGGNLVTYLIKEKKLGIKSPSDIVCLVRSMKTAEILTKQGVTIVLGDLFDTEKLTNFLVNNNVEYVYHYAGFVTPAAKMSEVYKPNVEGTQNMLDAFVKSNAKVFMYTSSISVYDDYAGQHGTRDFREDCPLCKPEVVPLDPDPYSTTKRIGEKIVLEYQAKYPDKTFFMIRPGMVIGPGDRLTLPVFVKLLSMKYIPKLINRGVDVLPLTAPYDIARAVVFLTELGSKVNGDVFNIVGDPTSFKRIYNTIAKYYQIRPPHISIPFWVFYLMIPIIFLIKIFLPHNETLKTFFSPTALSYIGKSMIFYNDKIKKLGFKFIVQAEETLTEALSLYDPDKKLIPADLFWNSKEDRPLTAEESEKISDSEKTEVPA